MNVSINSRDPAGRISGNLTQYRKDFSERKSMNSMVKVKGTPYEPVSYTHLGEGGFRSTINKKRPINTPADLKGIKIRVPENSTYVDTFKALGANPTTMASSECFTALQQGTIDGLEQPVTPMYTYKSYELCDYI